MLLVEEVNESYNRELRALANSTQSFLSSAMSMHEQILSKFQIQDGQLPFRLCWESGSDVILYIQSEHRKIIDLYTGILTNIAAIVFQEVVQVSVSQPNSSHCYKFKVGTITRGDQFDEDNSSRNPLSIDPKDNVMDVDLLSEALPFHVIFNKKMHILQMGINLQKHIGRHMSQNGITLSTYFDIHKPNCALEFDAMKKYINCVFELKLKAACEKRDNGQTVQVNIYIVS